MFTAEDAEIAEVKSKLESKSKDENLKQKWKPIFLLFAISWLIFYFLCVLSVLCG
jgi:hypothetical protein